MTHRLEPLLLLQQISQPESSILYICEFQQSCHISLEEAFLVYSKASQHEQAGTHKIREMCAGGVDQMLEWSSTVPRRAQSRPEEKKGDFDDEVNSFVPVTVESASV